MKGLAKEHICKSHGQHGDNQREGRKGGGLVEVGEGGGGMGTSGIVSGIKNKK